MTDKLARQKDVGSYIRAAFSEATERAYRGAWNRFASWCRMCGQKEMPAEPPVVAQYLADLAGDGKSTSSIEQARSAIRKAHQLAEVDDPCLDQQVVLVMRGIRRQLRRPPEQHRAATADLLKQLLPPAGKLRDDRDRAILLVGFAGAFRRSELAAIRVEDCSFDEHGVTIFVMRSKTDQEGRGHKVAINHGRHKDTCPVEALRVWMAHLTSRGITAGWVFRPVDRRGKILPPGRSDPGKLVWSVVKRSAKRCGMDPDEFGAHSLRAGLATEAARRGARLDQIAEQGRWSRLDTVREYIRHVDIYENVTKDIGL